MNTAWNQIPVNQQMQFLNATGLTSLPEPASLDASQWNALVNIVGAEMAENIRQSAAGGTVSAPTLIPPEEIGDWSTIMALVAELQAKLGNLQMQISTAVVEGVKADMKETNKQEAERIKEMLAKLEKASTSGLIGKIFGWFGAAVGLIGAIIATVATGGAAAPALVVACLGIGMMILQETGAMEKIINFVADNPLLLFAIFGPITGGLLYGLLEGGVIDKDQAKMGIQIALAAAMFVLSIAAMACSGGASATDTVFKIIGLVGQIVGGVAQVGAGSAGIAQSAYSYEAAMMKADSQDIQAWLAKLNSLLSEEMERLQEIIDRLNNNVVDFSSLLTDIAKSNQNVIASMGA